MTDFKQSETRLNLLRAFAGESQARNRYTIAAEAARKQKLHVVEAIFTFTAEQERAHAAVFYGHLSDLDGEKLTIEGSYPINVNASIEVLLRAAAQNEFDEHDPVYPAFAEVAEREGFAQIAQQFRMIADIEQCHGKRFTTLAEQVAGGQLFSSPSPVKWMCLNCGHELEANEAPGQCPVCSHAQGYFVRCDWAPWCGK